MTCKDCLHYEACRDVYDDLADKNYTLMFDEEDYARIGCVNYTDRSEWVHLPCKVGDTVYRLWYTPCHNGEIHPDSYGCEGCYDECDIKKAVMEYTVPNIGFIVSQFIDGSGIFYLTREEAEKALEKKK